MFNPQVCLLDLASTTPDSFLGSGPIYRRILFQSLILGRYHQTTCTDDTVVGYSYSMMYARSGGNGVVITYGR